MFADEKQQMTEWLAKRVLNLKLYTHTNGKVFLEMQSVEEGFTACEYIFSPRGFFAVFNQVMNTFEKASDDVFDMDDCTLRKHSVLSQTTYKILHHGHGLYEAFYKSVKEEYLKR